jgi:hypothetical protein
MPWDVHINTHFIDMFENQAAVTRSLSDSPKSPLWSKIEQRANGEVWEGVWLACLIVDKLSRNSYTDIKANSQLYR